MGGGTCVCVCVCVCVHVFVCARTRPHVCVYLKRVNITTDTSVLPWAKGTLNFKIE